MTAPRQHPTADAPAWHDDAMRLGAALDRASSALVVGRDGEAAAWAALGAAREQAARRRVAVADLVGDAQALAALADPDDAIGLSDSFFYGVSLNKIARPADDVGQLFVLPSGTEPIAVAEILESDRWRRLAAGFRDAGALLLLAARADAPGLAALAARVDGLVVVGDLGGALPDAPAPLMVIPTPTARRPRATPAGGAAPGPVDAPDVPPPPAPAAAAGIGSAWNDVVADAQRSEAERVGAQDAGAPPAPTSSATPTAPETAVPGPRRPRLTPAGGAAEVRPRRVVPRWALPAALAAVAAGVAVTFLGGRDRPAGPDAAAGAAVPNAGAPNAGAPNAGAPNAGAPNASAPAAPAAGAADAGPPLVVGNPGDSARAALYAVYLVAANSAEGASIDAQVDPTLPAPALTPVLEGGAPWWRLVAGAYPTQARAESLLVSLRRRGVLAAGSGSVVRAPYALLVADRVPAAQAPARVQALARQGVPTYPLSRGDGTVTIYAGAFERPADAAHLAGSLRAAGVRPALVYRVGSSQ